MAEPHIPTPELRATVAALASVGVPNEEIQKYLGICKGTLYKYYRDELEHAAMEKNAQVAAFLFNAASGKALESGASHSDCIRAAMFWGKTRMGLRETNRLEVAADDSVKTFADMYGQPQSESS